MTRLDKIKSMSAEELARVLIDTGMDNNIDFCRPLSECDEEVPDGACQKCLEYWLNEEVQDEQA